MHVWASLVFAIAAGLDAGDVNFWPRRQQNTVQQPQQPIVVTWSAIQPLGDILQRLPRQSINFGAFRQLNASTRERICDITSDALAKGPQFRHEALTSCLDPLNDALEPSWRLSRVVDACDALVDYLTYDAVALGLPKSCQDVASAPVMEYHVCLQTLQAVLQVAPQTAQHPPTALNAVDACSEVAQFPLDVEWCEELDQALRLEMNAQVHVKNHGAFCKAFVGQDGGPEPRIPLHEVNASKTSQASVAHGVELHGVTNQNAAQDDHPITQLPLTEAHTATFAVAHKHGIKDPLSGNAPPTQGSLGVPPVIPVAQQNAPPISPAVQQNVPPISPVAASNGVEASRDQKNVLRAGADETSLRNAVEKMNASVDKTSDSVTASGDDARAIRYVLTSASWASTCAHTLANGALRQQPTDFPLGIARTVLRACAHAVDAEESLAYSLCDDILAKFTKQEAHASTKNVAAFCAAYSANLLTSLQHDTKQPNVAAVAPKVTPNTREENKGVIMTKKEQDTRDALEKKLKAALTRDLVSEDKSALRKRLQSRTKSAAARFVDQVRVAQRAPSTFLRDAVMRNEKNVGAAIWELGQPSAADISGTSLSAAALNSKMQSSEVTGNDVSPDDGSLWRM
eukprot:GEMP01025989.1.p1 GENE.GEMP01025989.1~~GEMP01025989.1.p1  ORF type:complete len:628 (+),score=195.81 GEMP01025989.1:62-1945(+)